MKRDTAGGLLDRLHTAQNEFYAGGSGEGTPGLHGPLNAERRNGLAREVTECVLSAEGNTDVETRGHRVWCMIREQADGFCGAGGQNLRDERHRCHCSGRPRGGRGVTRTDLRALRGTLRGSRAPADVLPGL